MKLQLLANVNVEASFVTVKDIAMGWRLLVDNDFLWALCFKMGEL